MKQSAMIAVEIATPVHAWVPRIVAPPIPAPPVNAYAQDLAAS